MNTELKAAQIKLIRLALLGGILLFGFVAAFVALQNPEGIAMTRPGPLAAVVAGLVIVAAGVVMFIRRKVEVITDDAQRFKLLLIAHSVCEVASLVGGVHLLLTGGTLPFIAGLTVFVFSLVLLPIEKV
jgi:hypothetical protein